MSLIPNGYQLCLINQLKYTVVKTFTEEQFHNYLDNGLEQSSLRVNRHHDYSNEYNYFIKWYSQQFNQSRTQPIIVKDFFGKELHETPYSFILLNKKDNTFNFISAEYAYNIYKNYTKDIRKKYIPHYRVTCRETYRNTNTKGSGEKYYAKAADVRYSKSLNEPTFRGGHKKNIIKNNWDEWELETRSECGNWKRDTKLKHQYLVNVIKKNKQHNNHKLNCL